MDDWERRLRLELYCTPRVCATCGKPLVYWADGRHIHEDRTVTDHMAMPMSYDQPRKARDEPCPICDNYSIFNREYGESEAVTGMSCRCVRCWTCFDEDRVAIWSPFVGPSGIDMERVERYFGRWYDDERLEEVKGKLGLLEKFLKGVENDCK